MPIKTFAEWETEQRDKEAAQIKLERDVLIDMHMVALELGRRFKLTTSQTPPNAVRLTRANGDQLDISSKNGLTFNLTKHPPAESYGTNLSIDKVYESLLKFIE